MFAPEVSTFKQKKKNLTYPTLRDLSSKVFAFS